MYNSSGTGFSLSGTNYLNGSTVLRTDIGEGVDALRCTTDRVDCCSTVRAGQFYFPDDTLVPTPGVDPSIRTYYRNRDSGFIRLNRRQNGHETGRFICEIPETNGTPVNLTINIGMFMRYIVFITEFTAFCFHEFTLKRGWIPGLLFSNVD